MQEEIEDLTVKEKAMRAELKGANTLMGQIKQIKEEHSKKGVARLGKRSVEKVDKLKIRQKYLEGDCIMLAASVAYLGSLALEERIQIRKEISERLLLKANQETSNCWSSSESE